MPHHSEDSNILNNVFVDCVKGVGEVIGSIAIDTCEILKLYEGEYPDIDKPTRKSKTKITQSDEIIREHSDSREVSSQSIIIQEADSAEKKKVSEGEVLEFVKNWGSDANLQISMIKDGVIHMKSKTLVRNDELSYAADTFIKVFSDCGFDIEVKKKKKRNNKVGFIALRYPIRLDHTFIVID